MVTLRDIAIKAGTDISTVSRALNESPRVKDATRNFIKSIAQEMGYMPDEIARGLAGKKTNTIGIIVPEIINTFYAEIIDSIEEKLVQEGYSIILGKSNFDKDKEDSYIELFIRKRVDGIIISSHACPCNLLDQVRKKMPIVLVDTYEYDMDFDRINVDNMYGAKLAVEHLLQLGHKRIGFISDNITTAGRLEGYREALSAYGLPVEDSLMQYGETRFEDGGYRRMQTLLRLKEPPTAVFCVNDSIAIGAMRAVSDEGLKVPLDISVIGFDDIRVSAFLNTPLTTVRQPKGEIGNMAASMILQKLKGNKSSFVQHITLKPELVVRKTTAAPFLKV